MGPLLPCNVVVRALTDDRTAVETHDTAVIVRVTGNDCRRTLKMTTNGR